MGTRPKLSFHRAIVAVLMSFFVALPLASWAAARAPIMVPLSMSSSGRHGAVPIVHRRVRRHRRDWMVRDGRTFRAFFVDVRVPQAGSICGVSGFSSSPVASDVPPPDLPPV